MSLRNDILRPLALALLLTLLAAQGAAQGAAQEAVQDRAARLRSELADVQSQQAELQTRLAQLEEDLKPENIERSLAGVGSTHPEDLRAARRRQLEIQKKGIQTQLDSLAASRAHLEAGIATAEAESYRKAVGPDTTSLSNSSRTVIKKSNRQTHQRKRRRLRKTHS